MADPPPAARTSWLTTLGWACYLACSWTWCIGMFLPVLLVRDFGLWGFVVFAVPNVVGAAAMGWVLSAGAAATLVDEHRTAVGLFSIATILFQMYFLGWLVSVNTGNALVSCVIAAALGVLVVDHVWVRRSLSRRMAHAAATLAVSVGVGVVIALSDRPASSADGSLLREVGYLAPVCVFGFLCCPYLDATFLRAARQQESRARRASFGLGFAVFFAAMILITLLYTPLFAGIGSPIRYAGGTTLVYGALTLHLVVQLMFTVAAHQGEFPGYPSRAGVSLLVLAVVILGIFLPRFVADYAGTPHRSGLSLGEIAYRLFMSFYGLVFPAYVWLCMIPTRDGHTGIAGREGRRKAVVWLAAVVVAAPAFWMGFIERQTWWLAPGLGVVLLARLLVPGGAGFGRLRIEATSPAAPGVSGAA